MYGCLTIEAVSYKDLCTDGKPLLPTDMHVCTGSGEALGSQMVLICIAHSGLAAQFLHSPSII